MTVYINGTTGIDKVQDGVVQNATLATGVPSKAKLPTGTVLQVVNATYSTATASSSSTRADTGITATITPTSATSKVLVFVNVCGTSKASNNTWAGYWLMRNASDIIQFEGENGYTGTSATNSTGSVSTNYLDSPATTSSTVYKVQFASRANSAAVQLNNSGAVSTITLMEIAA